MGKLGYKTKQSAQEIPSFQRLKYLAIQDNNELEKEVKWINKFFGSELVEIKHFNIQAPQDWCDEQSFITDKKPIKNVEDELNKIGVEYLNLSGCFMENYSFYEINDKNKVIYEIINSQPNSTQVANKNKGTNTTRVKVNKLEI
ncbi:hypothetical protein [Mycoplasma sp. HF14]